MTEDTLQLAEKYAYKKVFEETVCVAINSNTSKAIREAYALGRKQGLEEAIWKTQCLVEDYKKECNDDDAGRHAKSALSFAGMRIQNLGRKLIESRNEE